MQLFTWLASLMIQVSELDPELSKSINYNVNEDLVKASKSSGVKDLYIVSSSVYGISESPNVTEEHPLVPLTQYNKYKALCTNII